MNSEEHYDLDSERMILSSRLLGGGEVYANIAGDIEIKDFSLKAHRDIFKVIVSCVNAGKPIGPSLLKKYGKLDEQVLSEIIATPSMVNISTYAKESREKSIKRQLLSFIHLSPNHISANRAVSEISDELSRDISTIISRVNSADIKNVNEVLGELLGGFKRRKGLENKHIIGPESGLSKLDDKTKGFKGGELIIVAVRPGIGKTTLCLSFIDNVLRQNKGVVTFSLKMPGIQTMQRLLVSKISVPLQKTVIADLNDDEWDRVSDACNYYAKTQSFLHDSGYASITDIGAILRRLKAQEDDISLCMVDYTGFMTSHSDPSDRHLQVSGILRGLKLLVREPDMPIIALS